MAISQIKSIKKVIVTDQEYFKSELELKKDEDKDNFTRRVLFTAQKLLECDIVKVDTETTGVVLGTQAGPVSSMKQTGFGVTALGYMGIMPLRFPNIMLSTSLYWLTKKVGTHGVSCAFYESSAEFEDSMEYACTQIAAGNCNSVILIQADEIGTMTGQFIGNGELRR